MAPFGRIDWFGAVLPRVVAKERQARKINRRLPYEQLTTVDCCLRLRYHRPVACIVTRFAIHAFALPKASPGVCRSFAVPPAV